MISLQYVLYEIWISTISVQKCALRILNRNVDPRNQMGNLEVVSKSATPNSQMNHILYPQHLRCTKSGIQILPEKNIPVTRHSSVFAILFS